MDKRYQTFKNGFTLIEVMVSVMIISVVIMAMIKMYGNNTHIFNTFKKQTKINQYTSFILSNSNYGFEDKTVSLYDLLSDFDFEDDLRKALKDVKVKLIYQRVETIGLGEEKLEDTEVEDSNVLFEVGKSIIKTQNSSISLLRVKIQ